MKKIKEAIAHFDDPSDTRSFNEIYAGREDLFEGDDIDGIISPKMRKLFESVYGEHGTGKLQEDMAKHDGPKPGNDGVSNAHNPPLSKGPTSEVTQSGARQDDDSKLGSEPAKGHGAGPEKKVASGVVQFTEEQNKEFANLFEKAQLKESLDDEFEFDAVGSGPDDIDPLDMEDYGSLAEPEDWFEDFDDGTTIPGSSDDQRLIADDFDLW